MKEWQKDWLLVGGLTLLGALLRFYDLTHWSLWFDELWSWGVGLGTVGEVVQKVRSDVAPPLYYLLLNGWMRVFGDGEFSLRALSAFCGSITVPVVFLLGKELLGRRVGLVAATLACFSPYLVYYSREARMYAMVPLLGAVSTLLLWWARKEGKAFWWVLYALASIAVIYTHYYGLLFFACHGLFLLWMREKAKAPWVAMAIVSAAFLPWLPSLLFQIHWMDVSPRQYAGLFKTTPRVVGMALYKLTAHRKILLPEKFSKGGRWLQGLQFTGAAIVAIPFAIGAFMIFSHCLRSEAARLLLCTGFAPILLAALAGLVRPVFMWYALGFVVPSLLIMAASALSGGFKRFYYHPADASYQKQTPISLVTYLGVAAVCAVFLAVNWANAYHPRYGKDDWRSALRYVQSHFSPSDLIIIPKQDRILAVHYYAPPMTVRATGAEGDFVWDRPHNNYALEGGRSKAVGRARKTLEVGGTVWVISNYPHFDLASFTGLPSVRLKEQREFRGIFVSAFRRD